MSYSKSETRIWEIDLLRGIAVVMMVLFNWLFALDYLGVYRTITDAGFWYYFARLTAALFILLAGVSLALSFSRKKQYLHHITRGIKIFSWGLVITAVTWLFLGENYVRFGTLHLIGISIILAYPFIKTRHRLLLAGIVFIITGVYLQQFAFNASGFEWLGFMSQNFRTVDYFPILPWFGVFLIGVFSGKSLYEESKRKYVLADYSDMLPVRALSFLGRNSLLIYLVHQPVLIAALYLTGVSIAF